MKSRLDIDCTVSSNVELKTGIWKLGLDVPDESHKPLPGTFAMLKLDPSKGIFLRRPFSYFDVNGKSTEFLYQVVGSGTYAMTTLKECDQVRLLGPLGNHYPMPDKNNQRVFMVAGGIGIAPFTMLAKALQKSQAPDSKRILIYGAASSDTVYCDEVFSKTGTKVEIATEDGSLGFKGLPTEILDDKLEAGDLVYACGPVKMMRRVKEITSGKGVKCLLSLDARMACGMGACMGCAVKAKQGYELVCKDGPIFDSNHVSL